MKLATHLKRLEAKFPVHRKPNSKIVCIGPVLSNYLFIAGFGIGRVIRLFYFRTFGFAVAFRSFLWMRHNAFEFKQ